MKKILAIIGLSFLVMGNVSLAQQAILPASTQVTFKVLNVSQDNKDAQQTGANPGDVLRYELTIKSDTEDINNFVASIDVSNILKAAELIDPGLGKLEGNNLIYPAFSYQAPCEQVFTFFVRVKENCGGMDKVTVTAQGISTNVVLHCGLAQTGLSYTWFIAGGIFCILLSFLLFFSRRSAH